MPIRLVVTYRWWTEQSPEYVNSVTCSTECPLTDKLDMLESPALRFWIFVVYQDTNKPSFEAVSSKMSRAV